MTYLTSKKFELPITATGMAGGVWFNMWKTRQWPYAALAVGNTLYWYESPTKTVRWKSRVKKVVSFDYANKAEAAQKLTDAFGPFDQEQPYFVDAPNAGYGLGYAIGNVSPVNLLRPDGVTLPRLGWLRKDEIAEIWPSL